MTSEGPARYGVVNPSLRSSGVRHPAWDILLQQPKLTLQPGAEWQRGRGTDQRWQTEESDDVDTLILGTPALGHHSMFLVLVLCWQSTFQGSHSPLISQSLAIFFFFFFSEPLTGMFSHPPPSPPKKSFLPPAKKPEELSCEATPLPRLLVHSYENALVGTLEASERSELQTAHILIWKSQSENCHQQAKIPQSHRGELY